MTRRADKFFAKKMEGGLELEWPTLHTVAGSPDGYHSAKETSDFEDDTEEEALDGGHRCSPTRVPSRKNASLLGYETSRSTWYLI